jgi:hypothetical protein
MSERPHPTRSTPLLEQGRGSPVNPPSRFERIVWEPETEYEPEQGAVETVFFDDPTRQILSTNDSPDVPFKTSVNPYRGCEHGCSYCFARPTHEYLGYSAGLDFETRIMVKPSSGRACAVSGSTTRRPRCRRLRSENRRAISCPFSEGKWRRIHPPTSFGKDGG